MKTTHESSAQLREADPRDPVTGAPAPDTHPVGTSAGAAAGALAGAALGAGLGPAGLAVGAVAGGLLGGLAGQKAAASFDPMAEESYWRENFAGRPYAVQQLTYDHYQPAYQTGYEGVSRYPERSFDEAEEDLRKDYSAAGGDALLPWDTARSAARDAWDRVSPRS